MKKVILIDGNNLMFRSYFATAYTGSIMRNSKGQATNALYGFTSMINKIVEEEKPEYMVVAFDIGKNFRHDKYTEYKAGRNATPDDLKSQMPIARKLLDALGIKHLELEGYEADDIIGTLAKEADLDPDYDALIVSSDHDLLQLISPQVTMKMLKSQNSIYYTLDAFKEEYGFDPIKIIDLKSLMGDSSDNIPGVKGIGEKTAKTLIQTYGSLDNIYANIENIKGKMKEKLEEDKENAYFSYELATIFKDVPLEINLSKLTYDGPNAQALKEIYTELEFHSLLKKINIPDVQTSNLNFKRLENLNDLEQSLEYAYFIECDKENYHDAKIIGMSLYDGKQGYFVPENLVKEVLDKYHSRMRYTYALKKNIVLSNKIDCTIDNTDFDLMIAYYLIDNTTKDDIALKMSDNNIDCYFYENILKNTVDIETFEKGIVQKSKFIWDIKKQILERLQQDNMVELFNNIEIPLASVLASMEMEGIRVNVDILKEMQKILEAKIENLKSEILRLAGKDFNISSPKQMGEILFEHLGIPYPAKKSGNYSTDNSILEKLKNTHEIIAPIMEYRTLNKLYNTYVEPLESFIREDSKIHTIYKQTLTRTGRLSSVEPNLQNIPTREEEGRLIKKAFLCEPESVLLSADYSQIELRILSHISGDETMIEAFKNGDDIHKRVAADIYGVPFEEVTKTMRSTAKHVIFGIVYGISGYGLGENLHISPTEAKKFIEKYYLKYPKVKEYMDNIKKEAKEKGFVKTLFNRIRYVEEIKSPIFAVRSGGERIALNTPIQGTGADIIKMAMVKLHKEMNRKNLKSKILLQVHDEIILNVYKDELETVKEMVQRNMESVTDWEVPLKVEIEIGNDWYEAK